MIAEYRQALFTQGPWFYRRLFWETGLIGQVLYLEAEYGAHTGDSNAAWICRETLFGLTMNGP